MQNVFINPSGLSGTCFGFIWKHFRLHFYNLHHSCRGSHRRGSPSSRWPPGCRRARPAARTWTAVWRTAPRATSLRSWGKRTGSIFSGSRGIHHCEGEQQQSISFVQNTFSLSLTHTELTKVRVWIWAVQDFGCRQKKVRWLSYGKMCQRSRWWVEQVRCRERKLMENRRGNESS